MFKSYLITALRSIRKDKQHPDSDRVYLGHSDHTAMGLQVISLSSFDTAEKVKNHSQIESIFKMTMAEEVRQGVSDLIEIKGDYHRLKNFYASSANILDFIQLTIIAGDIKQALSQPGQLVLSEREATRLFGNHQVMSQIIGQTLNHAEGKYTVGAVFQDLPENTHFQFDSLIHMPNQGIRSGYVYYKVLPGTDIPDITQQLTKESHLLSPWQAKQNVVMALINMEDLHFHSNGPMVMKTGGSLPVLQVFIGLSIILILIASSNFINLSIAQSAKRAKEVSIRKALGATKAQLVTQFLTESFLMVSLAGVIAFTLVEMTLPEFNQLMNRELTLNYGSAFIWSTVAVVLAVGLLSGLYPALFIASFSANRVLSGDLIRGGTAIFVRKLTLCFQGALSIGLIIAAVSLYQQMQLINNLPVGYEKSSRLVVKSLPSSALYKQDHNSLFAAIKSLSGVEQVTASNTDLTNDMKANLQFTWPNGEKLDVMQPSVATSYYAVETLGFKLLAGRDFSPKFSGDWYHRDEEDNHTVSVIVSRQMVELAGYHDLDSVIGMTILESRYNNMKVKIVGVIENVKIGSARQQVLPMSVNLGFVRMSATNNLVIKASNVDMTELSKQVQEIITKELHLSDVKITTVLDDYAYVHKNENRALEMVSIFSLLAIFLTCLGIFGLASFATLRRQKEVAMRKVLGASRLSIMNLLAKEFLLLIAISIVIAFPLSYWLIEDWLANFNERIAQAPWIYFMASAAISIITWLTVATLGFKAASNRPSLILRDE